MDSGNYVLGNEVASFEREFADYLGTSAVVGLANGTDALHLSLRALGVGAGDRVLTVSHTAIATLSAIELAGARPVFVDIDAATFTMDPNVLEDTVRRLRRRAATAQPKALVVVHIYGQSADMPAILDVARRYDLFVVEDCAQCHGASCAGRKAGTWGDIAAFSFYPTKNLGTFGDGGAVATATERLASRCRALREYGWDRGRISQEAGMNSRLDELHAALLRVKLRHLDSDNAARRARAGIYDLGLAESGVGRPAVRDGAEHVYHQYVVRSERRDSLRSALERASIGTAIHYWPPAHQHPTFLRYRDEGSVLRETERASAEIVSLPMFPQLITTSVRQVINAILTWNADAETTIQVNDG
jgi:dTDP-4-amino-4,6-dideoxygalactose transaminase